MEKKLSTHLQLEGGGASSVLLQSFAATNFCPYGSRSAGLKESKVNAWIEKKLSCAKAAGGGHLVYCYRT